MKAYAQAWQWKHPTGRDLFASLEQGLGEELRWYVAPAFYGTGAVDFQVRTADCKPQHAARGVFGAGAARKTLGADDNPDTGTWSCEVVVVNSGDIPAPVEVELVFADGSHARERWDARDGSRWHRFELTRSSPLAEVEIDPDGKVLLRDHPTDDHVRLGTDKRASWRAAARVGFWAHTAMQGVGL